MMIATGPGRHRDRRQLQLGRCRSPGPVSVIHIHGTADINGRALPLLIATGGRLLDLDPPSTALNATQVIWRFFAAHPR